MKKNLYISKFGRHIIHEILDSESLEKVKPVRLQKDILDWLESREKTTGHKQSVLIRSLIRLGIEAAEKEGF